MSELTELGIKVVSFGVWEYEHMTDPPARWASGGGPVDDEGNGTFLECVELGWADVDRGRSGSNQGINDAAVAYLDSSFGTEAYHAIGDDRFYVELFMLFTDANRREPD